MRGGDGASVDYRSRRSVGEAVFHACYRPTGAAFEPRRGSLDYFLTERYCLYAADRAGRTHYVDIHHPLWPLQPASADIRVNTIALAAGIPLPPVAALLHFSARQDVVNWMPVRL